MKGTRRRLAVGLSALAAAGTMAVTAPGQVVQASPVRASGVASGSEAAAGTGFVAVPATRLLDTRTSPTVHALGPGKTATVKVAGVGGVPSSGVEAVVLNLTGIAKTSTTYLTVYPAGAARPLASNLNLVPRSPRANLVFAQVGTGGAVTIYNSTKTSTDVIVDLTGYFTTSSSYTAQVPDRIGDSRNIGEPLDPGNVRVIHIRHHHGIPDTATTLVFNLTGIPLSPPAGFMTVYGDGTPRPATSNLSIANGAAAAVLVVVAIGDDGWIDVYNSSGSNHMTQDVTGYFTGTSDYHPVTPKRLLDSRVSGQLATGDNVLAVGGHAGVPANAGAAVLSLTAVKPDIRGWLSVHPGGSSPTGTSSLNVEPGATVANLVVAQLATDGTVEIQKSSMKAGVLVDVVGWLDTAQYGG